LDGRLIRSEVKSVTDGIYIPRGLVVVDSGELRILEARERESMHLCKTLVGWTVRKTILQELQDLEIEFIRLIVAD
jgi:hypothetical protein